jgi:hypothetical protein
VGLITGQEPDLVSESARRQTWRPFHAVALATLALTTLVAPTRTFAADLKPATLQAWQEYVRAADTGNQAHLMDGTTFLKADTTQGQGARLRQGEIVVAPAGPNVPIRVPSGLIHDWTGAVFIANATILDVMGVVRDYTHYRDVYHPNVIEAKPTEIGEWADRFSMLLMNKTFFAKGALDSDFRSTFTRLNEHRWYSVSEATRIQEIAEYGGPSQHTLPADQGTGVIWRLHSIARFEERDGGVYIELEAIALSRDIPASLRWLVEPIARRVSRSSLATSLLQTEEAVRSNGRHISRSSDRPPCSPAGTCRATTNLPSPSPLRSFR